MRNIWFLGVGLLGCITIGVCVNDVSPIVPPRVVINAEEEFLQTCVDSFGLYGELRSEASGREYSEPDPLADGGQSL